MLSAIIDDTENNVLIHLYVNYENGVYKISGFSLKGNNVLPVNEDVFSYFNVFKLNDANKEKTFKLKDYDVILDKRTKLYHYFKNGNEDFDMLFRMNGVDALSYYNKTLLDKEKSEFRKFNFKFLTLYVSTIFISINVVFGVIGETPSMPINGERVEFSSGISYILNFSDPNRFSEPANLEMIRDYIYNSKEINNQLVKDFLYNEDLLKKVIPCYNGSCFEILAKLRHNNISVNSFGDYESKIKDFSLKGYYAFGNEIKLRDYNEEKFRVDSVIAKRMAHEYVHLLQSLDCYPFIREAAAEVISEEFFFNHTNSKTDYAYSDNVKYLKVLMEIIGTKAVWNDNFVKGSNMVYEEVKPYLSEDEFHEFLNFMNVSGAEDMNNQDKYNRFEEILEILYRNKYGLSMYEDEMISAILNDKEYNRPYFKDSLIVNSVSCYVDEDVVSLEEAYNSGEVSITKEDVISRLEFFDRNINGQKHVEVVVKNENVRDYDVNVTSHNVEGVVNLLDGSVLSISDAEKLGFIEMIYKRKVEINVYDYLDNFDESSFYDFIIYSGGAIDKTTKTISRGEKTYFVSSIDEKFLDNTIKLS